MITMNIRTYESNLLKALDKQKNQKSKYTKCMLLEMILRPGRIQLITSYLFSQHSCEIGKPGAFSYLKTTKMEYNGVK